MPAPAYMSRDRVTCWLVAVAPAGSFWAFGEGMIAGAEAGRHEPSALRPQLRERKGTRQQRTCVCVRCGGWVGMTGDKCAERGRRDTNRQGNRKSQSMHKLPTQWLANHEPPGGLVDPPDLPLPCTANCTRRLRASPLYPYYPSRHSPYSLVALISSLHATQLGRRRSSMYDNYQQELSSRDAHTYVYVYVSLLNGHRLSAMQS